MQPSFQSRFHATIRRSMARTAPGPASRIVWTMSGPPYRFSFPSGWGDCPGLQIATEPWLPKPRIEDYATLKPGFVFHVRAMARHVGWAGVGVSETVAVTEEGAAILTADERYMMMIDK